MTDTSPVIITYDNVAVFDNLAGTQPIPFVSKSHILNIFILSNHIFTYFLEFIRRIFF